MDQCRAAPHGGVVFSWSSTFILLKTTIDAAQLFVRKAGFDHDDLRNESSFSHLPSEKQLCERRHLRFGCYLCGSGHVFLLCSYRLLDFLQQDVLKVSPPGNDFGND